MLLIKIKQQDLLRNGQNISDSIAFFYESIHDLFEVTRLGKVALPKTKGQFSIYQHGKPF